VQIVFDVRGAVIGNALNGSVCYVRMPVEDLGGVS